MNNDLNNMNNNAVPNMANNAVPNTMPNMANNAVPNMTNNMMTNNAMPNMANNAVPNAGYNAMPSMNTAPNTMQAQPYQAQQNAVTNQIQNMGLQTPVEPPKEKKKKRKGPIIMFILIVILSGAVYWSFTNPLFNIDDETEETEEVTTSSKQEEKSEETTTSTAKEEGLASGTVLYLYQESSIGMNNIKFTHISGTTSPVTIDVTVGENTSRHELTLGEETKIDGLKNKILLETEEDHFKITLK